MIEQNLLDKLYGSEIEKFDFNISSSYLCIHLKVEENDKVARKSIIFNNIEKMEFNNINSDITNSILLINEIFNLTESKELNIDPNYYNEYNYLIDGDGFDLFVFSNNVFIK